MVCARIQKCILRNIFVPPNNIYKHLFSNIFMKRGAGNRGQLTIFIIIAVVIVAAVSLFFLFRSGVLDEFGAEVETNPNAFFDSCLRDEISESVRLIALQGGFSNVSALSLNFKFDDEADFVDMAYLCYNQNYYFPCINQEPMLFKHLNDELKNDISQNVKDCFDDLTLSLERAGYVVDAKYNGFVVELMPGQVSVKIDSELSLTKANETLKYKDFEVSVLSRFYDLAFVVQEIVSQEARFCNFEHLGYMLTYPQFDIDKFRTGDSSIIYSVESKDSKELFRFAVRSCVIPPGF